MSFWKFWERFSIQMLQYDPQHCLYLGDEALRKSTQQTRPNTRHPKQRDIICLIPGFVADAAKGVQSNVQHHPLSPYV
jgi:hypothetical protein